MPVRVMRLDRYRRTMDVECPKCVEHDVPLGRIFYDRLENGIVITAACPGCHHQFDISPQQLVHDGKALYLK